MNVLSSPPSEETKATRPVAHEGLRSLSYRLIVALTLALLPIGILAVALGSANLRSSRAEQERFAQRQFDAVSKTVGDLFSEDILLLQSLLLKRLDTPEQRTECDLDLTRAANFNMDIAALIRVNAGGQVLCASAGGPQPSPAFIGAKVKELPGRPGFDRQVALGPRSEALYIILRDNTAFGNGHTVIATLDAANLQERLSRIVVSDGGRFALRLGNRWVSGTPITRPEEQAAERTITRVTDADGESFLSVIGPLAVPGLQLEVATPVRPLGGSDILALLLPGLMWLAALLISWISVRRLVNRPLQTMARDVRSYGHGEYQIRLSPRAGSSVELRQFASAFDQMADEAAVARSRIGEALATQQRLMREVHHRVKNNLQIIASLLSIQAREEDSAELGRAYGTIQMRVNALALVHRWLFEDQTTGGVDFGSLAHDLCGSLEYSVAAVEHIEPRINARIERLFVSQDAAVPLAFLITELVAMAGRLGAEQGAKTVSIDVVLSRRDTGGCLALASPAFSENDTLAAMPRSASTRIVQGMVRQIRGSIDFDSAARAFVIQFPLAAASEAEGK